MLYQIYTTLRKLITYAEGVIPTGINKANLAKVNLIKKKRLLLNAYSTHAVKILISDRTTENNVFKRIYTLIAFKQLITFRKQ